MHTNRKLFDLATINSQRDAANEFLSSIPESMKAIFDKANVIYHPELSVLFSPVIHRANQLHCSEGTPVAGTKTLLTSSKEKALSHFLLWAADLPDGECILVLGGGNGFSFNGETGWVSRLPGYMVQISEAIELVKHLSQQGLEEAAVVFHNLQHALILEAYSDHLPDEPTDREVVYEMSAW